MVVVVEEVDKLLEAAEEAEDSLVLHIQVEDNHHNLQQVQPIWVIQKFKIYTSMTIQIKL